MKFASWIWPTWVGAVAPAASTLTVPSLPMVMLTAFGGMVIVGCSG
jgi:hypothetical protein